MAQYSWEALTAKYRGWQAPAVEVSIDGQPLLDREWRLQSLQCSLSTGIEASVCTLVLGNVYDRKNSRFTCENILTLGSSVRVSLGYIKASLVFVGYLYEIEYELGETASVTLRCMDVKGAMMGSSFITEETTFRKGIRSMFSGPHARGYSILCSAPAMENLPELNRLISFDTSGLDDFGFLRQTAELWGLECFVRQGNLLLRKKPQSKTSVVEISPGDFHSLSASFSTTGYVHMVRVRGGTDDERDGEKKRVAAQAENANSLAPAGSKAARVLNRVAEFYVPSVRDSKGAKERAEGELRRRNQSGNVRLSLRGLPDLFPGDSIDLRGISPKINGKYYVTEVTHQFNETAFSTWAVCRKG